MRPSLNARGHVELISASLTAGGVAGEHSKVVQQKMVCTRLKGGGRLAWEVTLRKPASGTQAAFREVHPRWAAGIETQENLGDYPPAAVKTATRASLV